MSHSKPMVSLSESFDRIMPHLEALKARSAELKANRPEKAYGDFRHINDRNLEELDLALEDAPTFTVRDIPECGLCLNGQTYYRDELGYQYGGDCIRCTIIQKRITKLNRLLLPPDAYGVHFGMYQWDSNEQRDRVAALNSFISYGAPDKRVKSPSVYLWGSPGNGKTSLLYCMAKESIFADLRVKYVTHQMMIESRYAQIKGDRNPLKGWLDNVDLLLFDELGGVGGRGHQTDWLRSFNAEMYSYMYERWSRGLAIVMTTNLTPDQFYQSTGRNAAIMSRFAEMFGEPIKMTGRDRRTISRDLSSWGVK